MINYLLTNKGERVFRPLFGADLRNLLFENILDVTVDDLKTSIQNDISVYFPNVEIKEIEFNNQPDNNTINFNLTYQIVNFGIEDSLNISLQ
jgi:phage baseplate assembly protein W